jgi:hypothetical protein
MRGLVWYFDTLTPSLVAAPVALRKAVQVFTEVQSQKVQDYMRNNAPWTDRTGNARGGLFAQARHSDAVNAIVFYHTMPYGIFLEVSNGGTYAIIVPTLNHEGRRVMSELRGLMSKMGKVV